jgi:integrase
VGSSLLQNAGGWETGRTHRHHRSCQKHRPQEGRRIAGSRSSEAARNHQPITALPGKTENVWPVLSALHRERAADRPIDIGGPKEFPTIETYERHLIKRIIPRWGNLAPLQVKSTEVERWFLELRKGNPQEKIKPYADRTVDKIRRIMHLVYKHGQRHEFLPRQQEGNPMHWVSQRTTSDYTAVPMTPKQAFEVLLNIPEPRRTLTLSDAATALRVSELLALMWMDLDFRELVMYVRRAYVWGRFKVPKSRASKAPVPIHPLLAWREKTPFRKDTDFVFPSVRLKGKKPLSASIMVQNYLRPAAVKAGVIKEGEKVRFGFHNFRHSLATALVKLKVDPKTVQGMLRHEDFGTTMQLYVQSDMEAMRDAQGKFLEQLLGDRTHLLTETVQ